jgi:hypothetical protein
MSIPKDIVIPRGNQFAKLQDGKNRIRVLSDIVVGWEGWKNKKPFRHEGNICKIKPEQVDTNQYGNPNISYFWAMVVYNYTQKSVQVLEITPKSIMTVLKNLEDSPDWGDLKGYDVEIDKTKVGDKTTYTVVAIPPKPLNEDIVKLYSETKVDLQALFKGDYPMDTKTEEIDPDSIPFD